MKYSPWFLCVSMCLVAVGLARAASVKDFGAKGDGVADDTAAIQRAVTETTDGVVDFPRGAYRLTATVRVPLDGVGRISLQGGGVGRVVMAGRGPAFYFAGTHRGTAGPQSFKPGIMDQERMPQVDGLEIVGAHPEADGLEFSFVMQPTVRGCFLRELRHGIRFSAGSPPPERITTSNRNPIIIGNHIYNCLQTGIIFEGVDLHQIIISSNHISYCKRGGIRITNASIRNLEIVENCIEYNYDANASESADIWMDVGKGSIREGVITGNNIQAVKTPGGANIRLVGTPGTPNKLGLFAISGNHISSQSVNIHLRNVRGITVNGNSLLRGGEQALLIEGSRNIVVGTNAVDNNPDYIEKGQQWLNGVVVRDSEGIILNGLQVDGSAAGSSSRGGAVEVTGSRQISVSGGQILAPKFRGLYIENSQQVQVTGMMITAATDAKDLVAGIEIRGGGAVTLGENSVARGSAGDVVRK